MSGCLKKIGRYRTTRRFHQLAALDGRLMTSWWHIRAVHLGAVSPEMRFRAVMRLRRVERTRVEVGCRLKEIVTYGVVS